MKLPAGPESAVTIFCDFPGGNIVLDGIEGDTVSIHQDERDTEGGWFYWCFGVRGAAGRSLVFRFTRGAVIGTRGPGLSFDQGRSWQWAGAGCVTDNAVFRYTFAPDATDVRFSFGMPYLEAHLREFLRRHADHPLLRVETLCRTPAQRDVECLRFGNLSDPTHRVLLTCRHHCCEMMANYALEGIIEAVLGGARAGSLAATTEFMAIPFVDKDGVEAGDQGKNRRPRDHGRDYTGESLYAAPRALRQRVPAWSQGLLRLLLDLHCPWIRGVHNEEIYLVGSSYPENWREQCRFGEILEQVRTGPLPYAAADNLPFGQSWNTGGNYDAGNPPTRWAFGLPGVRLSTGIEIPYANAKGVEVNAGSARRFGRDLAAALAGYLARGAA